jgi:pyrroloquinoline quinone biosynthesis protein D
MSKKLVKVPGAFTQTEIDDEIVVMSLDTGDFFSLTGTARSIWQRLDDGPDRDRLVAALTADFGADDSEVAQDVDAFLAQLIRAGLLAEQ